MNLAKLVLEARRGELGSERPGGVDLLGVETGVAGEVAPAKLRVDALLEQAAALGGLRLGASQHEPEPGQDQHLADPAAVIGRRRHRSSRRNSTPAWIDVCGVKTTSAIRPARPIPAGDEPACASTGWPCGGRGIVSGPVTS